MNNLVSNLGDVSVIFNYGVIHKGIVEESPKADNSDMQAYGNLGENN